MKKILFAAVLSSLVFYTGATAFAYSAPTVNEIRRALMRSTQSLTGNATVNFNLSGDLAANNYSFSPVLENTAIKSCNKESNRPGYICIIRVSGAIMGRGPEGLNSYPVAGVNMDAKGRFFMNPSTGEWTVSYVTPIRLWSPYLDCTGTSSCRVKYNVPDISSVANGLPKQFETYRNVGVRETFTVGKLYKLRACTKTLSGITCDAIIKGIIKHEPVDLMMSADQIKKQTVNYYAIIKQPVSLSENISGSVNVSFAGQAQVVAANTSAANLLLNPMSIDTKFDRKIASEETVHPKTFGKYVLDRTKFRLGKTTEDSIMKILGTPAYIQDGSYTLNNRVYRYKLLQYEDDLSAGLILIYINPNTKRFAGYDSKYYDPASKSFVFGYSDQPTVFNTYLPWTPAPKKVSVQKSVKPVTNKTN